MKESALSRSATRSVASSIPTLKGQKFSSLLKSTVARALGSDRRCLAVDRFFRDGTLATFVWQECEVLDIHGSIPESKQAGSYHRLGDVAQELAAMGHRKRVLHQRLSPSQGDGVHNQSNRLQRARLGLLEQQRASGPPTSTTVMAASALPTSNATMPPYFFMNFFEASCIG